MRTRLLLEWLLVASLAVGAVLLLSLKGLTERADNAIYDALLPLRATTTSDVVIVAIDAPSLAAIGRWPWPRSRHAAALRRIAAARPAAIGYDVLFVEPAADDAALAAAARTTPGLVLPMTFVVPGADGRAFDAELPVPTLAPATRVGHADLLPDRDGIVRGVALLAGDARSAWPHFAEQLHRAARGRSSPAFRRARTALDGRAGLQFAAPLLIPFSGPTGHHRTVPFVSLLKGEVPPELLAGRVVLVGSTAAGSGDQYPVPAGAMPGVEIQANIVDALLADRAIRPAGTAAALALALVPLALLLAALLLLPPRVNVLLGLGLILGVVATSASLLLVAGWWVPPAAALAGLMIVYPLWGWRRLEAANAYMLGELRQLRREPDPLPGLAPPPARRGLAGEAIAQQSTLLHSAIERVRDLRRFFAESLRELPDATLVLDAAGHVLVANRAADALFGPPPPGTPADALLRRLDPEAAPLGADVEREMMTADGRSFVLRTAPLTDAQGSRVGSILRLTEITAIRLATRQREEALQLLSHDMRSPQASILALVTQAADQDAAETRRRIAGHAERTLALADGFVQLARAEASVPGDALVDFAQLLVEAVDEHWALARAKDIRLATAGEEAEQLVRGDAQLLGRMLANLVGNAIKYSAGGTVVHCTVGAEAPDRVRCDIADQGRGIPPEEVKRVFERFRRVPGVAGPDGAGLGLAFVRTVAQRHGGTVHCTSMVGVGTTFTVRLPRAGRGDG